MKFFSCLLVFAVLMAVFVQIAPASKFQLNISKKESCRERGNICSDDSQCCSGICYHGKNCKGFGNAFDTWDIRPCGDLKKYSEKCASDEECCSEMCNDTPSCVDPVNN